MKLDIVTPERRLVLEDTDDVIAPAMQGEVEILPGHAPYLSLLKTGVFSFIKAGKPVRLMVSGGFFQVDGDTVTVMADQATLASEVNSADSEKRLATLEAELLKLGAVDETNVEANRLKLEAERNAAKLMVAKA